MTSKISAAVSSLKYIESSLNENECLQDNEKVRLGEELINLGVMSKMCDVRVFEGVLASTVNN